MPDYNNPSAAQSRNSIKSLHSELSNLTPSSLVTMFEIDISNIISAKGINLTEDAKTVGVTDTTAKDGVLRFHNNIKVFNSIVDWQGKTFFPAPIKAEGFESTSKGTLPQPRLSLSSQSETGNDQLALLKHEIRKIGDIIGAKVTRKRTFAKYLDITNFGDNKLAKIGRTANMLPEGYEPDPYAHLPDDIYFIERKETENKTILVYQLSSVLDLEGTKLPKRVVLADKCVWQYRGIGCWYQEAYNTEITIDNSQNLDTVPPVLEKAELKTLREDGDTSTASRTKIKACGLPEKTPPIATDSNENIKRAVGLPSSAVLKDQNEFKPSGVYIVGDYVYITKDKIKYYFVCKEANGSDGNNNAIEPPNVTYWVADECSKSLTGCRMRWGTNGAVKTGSGCSIIKNQLPYGGFPAAKKMSRLG